jgi:transcriptional regulator with XRE-family HTH domain
MLLASLIFLAMPAKPLSPEQKADADRLKAIYERWRDANRLESGKKLSQAEVAFALGFGQSALSQYLNGSIPLNAEVAVNFARVFSCRVLDFSPAIALEIANLARPTVSPSPSEQADTIDDRKKGIALRLKSSREGALLSLIEVGKGVGATPDQVEQWERGDVLPDALQVRELAKLYNVSVDGLLWEDSLSPEAMQLAVEFDSLSEKQKRMLSAMWMAFIRESASDLEIEDRMSATKQFKYEKKTNVAPFSPADRTKDEETGVETQPRNP